MSRVTDAEIILQFLSVLVPLAVVLGAALGGLGYLGAGTVGVRSPSRVGSPLRSVLAGAGVGGPVSWRSQGSSSRC